MSEIQRQIQKLVQLGHVSQARQMSEQACRKQPGNPEVWRILSQLQAAAGDLKDAVNSLKRLVNLQPNNATAWFNMGLAEIRLGRVHHGKECLMQVISIDPKRVNTVLALAELHKHDEDHESALRVLRNGLEASPADVRLNWFHGLCLQDIGRLIEGVTFFRKANRLMRQLTATNGDAYPTRDPEPGDAFKYTAPHKLGHDAEQIEYLVDVGLLPASYRDEAHRYRRAQDHYGESEGQLRIAPLTREDRFSIGGTYNRMVFDSSRGKRTEKALNPDIEWQSVVAQYRENAPGIAWADDLLLPEVREELHAYCLESTVWYDFRHDGYVGAYVDDGFDCPLLIQIAEVLRAAMPELLADSPLRSLWAYKYDRQLKGIGTYADSAEVNINFWVTPDRCNLDPTRGALVVYRAKAPTTWDFETYNNDRAAIRRFLDERHSSSVRVPYRCNRALVFNSDLFHETDSFLFKDSYDCRRINITMLFGERQDRN